MIPGLWRAMHETIHRYLKKKNEKGNEEREREETSMKKFKKLLAGLLAGAMMLGSMSATAFAAEETEPVSTIDYTKRGSLTLYKYYFKNKNRYFSFAFWQMMEAEVNRLFAVIGPCKHRCKGKKRKNY